MKETGIVNKVDGNRVTVGCGAEQSCSSCSGGNCGSRKRLYEAVNVDGLKVEIGDLVEIYLDTRKAVASAFMVFILPLLLFAAGYLVAKAFDGTGGEGFLALGGLLGLAAGFGISFLYSKGRKAKDMAIVTAVKRHFDLSEASKPDDNQTSSETFVSTPPHSVST